jgi:hypothetical protein
MENQNESAPVVDTSELELQLSQSFIIRYHRAIKHWLATKPNERLPIQQLPDGSLAWVNRAARRRLEKLLPKPKIYAHNYK